MSRIIIGPTLPDLLSVGITRPRVAYICTAYYTAGPLKWFLKHGRGSKKVVFAFRHDPDDLSAWVYGSVDPPALLDFVDDMALRGVPVELRADKAAHVKQYIGNKGALVGSANFTTRGFSASLEVGCLHSTRAELKASIDAADKYIQQLKLLRIEDFRRFVNANRTVVGKSRRGRSIAHSEQRVSPSRFEGAAAVTGNYRDFTDWLLTRQTAGAQEIYNRSQGTGNLRGHIHRNFFGLRQFLIANPDYVSTFSQSDEDTYKLSGDPTMEAALANFVTNSAADERDFVLDRWKTYLPIECGGRATRHGGTIGNLNRMFPLVAKYLRSRGL